MLLKSSMVRMTVSYPEIMAIPLAITSAAKAIVTAILVLPFGLRQSTTLLKPSFSSLLH